MNIKNWSLLAGCLVLSACASPVASTPGSLTVTGAVHVRSDAAAYRLQATRVPYELARLSKIEIFITDMTTAGATEVDAGELPHTGSGDDDHVFSTLKLKNLAPSRAYRVRLEAYQVDPAQGTDPVRVDLDDNHQSETDFTTVLSGPNVVTNGSEDVLDIDALKGGFSLYLQDQTFNGKASGSVNVTNGQLNPTGVAIGLEAN